MGNKQSKEFNPLKTIWGIIMNIFGVVGMVSFTENLVAWEAFILKLAESYQRIIYYPFISFNIQVPERIIDYFFIGSLLGISYGKAINYGIKNQLLSTRGTVSFAVKVFYYVLYLLFWPLGIAISFKQVFVDTSDVNEKTIKLKFLQWVGSTLIIFFTILIINSMM